MKKAKEKEEDSFVVVVVETIAINIEENF